MKKCWTWPPSVWGHRSHTQGLTNGIFQQKYIVNVICLIKMELPHTHTHTHMHKHVHIQWNAGTHHSNPATQHSPQKAALSSIQLCKSHPLAHHLPLSAPAKQPSFLETLCVAAALGYFRGVRTLSLKGQIVNIWGFVSQAASAATTQLHCCTADSATELGKWMDGEPEVACRLWHLSSTWPWQHF